MRMSKRMNWSRFLHHLAGWREKEEGGGAGEGTTVWGSERGKAR